MKNGSAETMPEDLENRRQYLRQYWQKAENKERANALRRKRHRENPEIERKKAAKRLARIRNDPELLAAHKERKAKQNKAYYKRLLKLRRERYRDDPAYRVHMNMFRVLRKQLHNDMDWPSWKARFGYSIADLRIHLASQFADGMSWDNYGKNGWQIDHIRPVSSFTFTTADDPEYKVCWALENLRPVWPEENREKWHKIIE